MTTATQPTLTPRADGGYTVTLDGVELGWVKKMTRSWAWYMAGDDDGCPLLVPTRTEAARRVVACHDGRAMVAATEAAEAARDAAQTEAVRAEGYELADVADVTEGQMVRLWNRSSRSWSDPVLAVRVTTFDNGGATMVYTRLVGDVTPTDVILMVPDNRNVMRRERTEAGDRAWARWLVETDDSPEACAARAVPAGWTPDRWDEVVAGDVIRYPTRVRNGLVYEWSDACTIASLTRHTGTGGLFLTYDWIGYDGEARHSYQSLPAPMAEHGILRAPVL